ncbi:MAG TPA: DapH/DapD/GlmU-related protein [Opitutaceae bacterium]|nr:DapH/DapD/GlmU-related protein [Opitutaceae bacterium]
MSDAPTKTYEQDSPYASPWTIGQRVRMILWSGAWTLLCRWTPKPLNPWRLFVLRLFGATLRGTPFVHQKARIQIPWTLEMHHRACLGDGAMAYSLAQIIIEEGATIAQEAYLCTGTHDFALPSLPLKTSPIRVGAHAFVGARAFVLPGVTIGRAAIVGACAVVTKSVPDSAIVAGNPAKAIGTRSS